MQIPQVKGAIDKKRLSIRLFDDTNLALRSSVIHYDDVPLWRTVAPLEDLDIFLYDAKGSDEEPYTLMCRDSYGDIYTYGGWWSIDDAKAWLEEPKKLY